MTLCTWYRGQEMESEQVKSCYQCGADGHGIRQCTYKFKVCYTCKDPSHTQKNCPKNDGSRSTEDTILFLNSKSAFSNWNVEYPFVVDHVKYSCVEQFCMSKKCELFGDKVAQNEVMRETAPREMKIIGDKIKDYDHRVWVDVQRDVVFEGAKAKFYQNMDAREGLIDTGKSMIGEATTNRKWGIGIHIKDTRCLHSSNWVGENEMGKILMEIRDELIKCDEVMDDINGVLGTSTAEQENKGKDGESSDTNRNTHDDSLEGEQGSEGGDIDDDSVEIELPWAILVGDSNVTGMNFEGTDIPVQVEVIAEGGTKLKHITKQIEECKINSEEVRVVVVHVGSCEWNASASKPADAEQVYREYIEALNIIADKYRHAEIAISGVPPRASKGQNKGTAELINIQIKELNKRLNMLTIDEDNIMFVDNDTFLKDKSTGLVCPGLYTDTVHLSNTGRATLKDSLTNVIREGFAKNGLRLEWNVNPGHS